MVTCVNSCQVQAAKEAQHRAEAERDAERAVAKEEIQRANEATKHLEAQLHRASRDQADAADRFSRERDNDRRLLQELESQMLATIRDREREAESAAARTERVRDELSAMEKRLDAERKKVCLGK